MGSADDPNSSSALRTVISGFASHFSEKRVNTDSAVLSAIRNAYQDSHVTPIPSYKCALKGYAKAGHATMKLLTTHTQSVWERDYKAPSSRLQHSDGTLEDEHSFAQYSYQWLENSYTIYIVSWIEAMRGRVCNYYILSPLLTLTADSQHSIATDNLILHASKWTNDLHDEIYVFDAGRWTKNAKLFQSVQASTWDDVILDPAMKATLIHDVDIFFSNRALYEIHSVPWKRGLILHGQPGCGKTISIKALMRSLALRPEPVVSLYVKSLSACDGPQYSIRTIFRHARAMAPCLLIFEDLDSLVTNAVRSYFLNEVDGLEANNGVLMLGSTNHLDRLDPSIAKRPSRFDRKYHYKLPGARERLLYARYWKRKLALTPGLDFPEELCHFVAEATAGFSFAYLKELFVQCLLGVVSGRGGLDEGEGEVALGIKGLKSTVQGAEVMEEPSQPSGRDENVVSNESVEGNAETNSSSTAAEMAAVDVSEALGKNPFFQILRQQIEALVREMDSTEDEGKDPSKSKVTDADDTDGDTDGDGVLWSIPYDPEDFEIPQGIQTVS